MRLTVRAVFRAFATSGLLLAVTLSAFAQGPRPYPKRISWWGEARFGMFIHWGPVSLKGTEISWSRANSNPKCPNAGPISVEEYDNLYKRFNPTKFDAKEWVKIAKASGMKYMVLTAKHCDGFLLWDSKVSDYNIMHTPFKRDVCAELAKACHEQGMRIGWYYSPMDWKDPDCRNEKNAEFVKRMQGEIRELLTNYGKIDLLWFDYDGREIPWDQKGTYALVKKLQPGIVIDNRLDVGLNGNAADPATIGPNADYFTPEQWIGGYYDQKPWESCMTVSSRDQWAWGGESDGVKPFETLMNMVFGCAGGDGNVLLNVGPTPEGVIAPIQANRIKQVGGWLSKYGESIYGTRGGPFKPGEYGVSTRKGKTIYLHLRDATMDKFVFPAIAAKVSGVKNITGGTVRVKQGKEGLVVTVPKESRRELDTVIAIQFDRSVMDLPALAVPTQPSLSSGAKATASNTYQGDANYGPDKAVDGNGDSRWATDTGTKSAWLELDLGKPTEFSRAVVLQAYPELKRVRKFAIEYWDGSSWKACYEGKDMGPKLNVSFPKVTAQRVRLNITEATDGPTIFEFKLFN